MQRVQVSETAHIDRALWRQLNLELPEVGKPNEWLQVEGVGSHEDLQCQLTASCWQVSKHCSRPLIVRRRSFMLDWRIEPVAGLRLPLSFFAQRD